MSKFILIQNNKPEVSTNSKTYKSAKKKFLKYTLKNPSKIQLNSILRELNHIIEQSFDLEDRGINEFFNGDINLYNYWKKNKPHNIQNIKNKKYKNHIIEQLFNMSLGGRLLNIIDTSRGLMI